MRELGWLPAAEVADALGSRLGVELLGHVSPAFHESLLQELENLRGSCIFAHEDYEPISAASWDELEKIAG